MIRPKKDYVEEFEALDRRYGVGDIVLDRLKNSVGDRRVLVCTIGYTGTKHFDLAVKSRFDAWKINYEARMLKEKDKKGGNYRPFDADPEELRSDAEILMLFDGIIEDGGTMTGANVWALENLHTLGGPRIVLSFVIKDNKGFANYSFVPTFFIDEYYGGPARAIKLLAPPDKASKLDDWIPNLSTENPYDHETFRHLGEAWREHPREAERVLDRLPQSGPLLISGGETYSNPSARPDTGSRRFETKPIDRLIFPEDDTNTRPSTSLGNIIFYTKVLLRDLRASLRIF